MGLRNIALVAIFSMICVLLGVLAAGDFTGGTAGGPGNFLAADYFAAQSSRTVKILTHVLPERIVLFLYILDKKVLFFGGVALFSFLMSGMVILRAMQFSPDKTAKQSAHTMSARQESDRGITQLSKIRTLGLTWKIAGTFAGVVLLVGLLVSGAVFYSLVGALRNQINRRAFAIATNLSDGAAGYVLANDFVSLRALLVKYALLEGVAYAFVEDREGRVLARSLDSELVKSTLLSRSLEKGDIRRTVIFRGEPVDETRVPILEGKIGAVHVGIWSSAVEREIRQAGFRLLAWILPILVLGVLLAVILARRIQRPIRRLAEVADRMSKGDLDTPVGVESGDEIGSLALSLERMRASLKAAITRLNR